MKPSPAHLDAPPAPVAERLAALADPVQLRALRLLEREELSVGEASKALQLPQSTASRRLKALADAGWVARRQEGTATLFRFHPDALGEHAAGTWRGVRALMGDTEELAQDERRLDAVLRERRVDSRGFFGRVAGQWDDIRATLFGRGVLAGALPALLPASWTVADFGCGTGEAAARLAPFVERVIAIDNSDAMLGAARARLAGAANVEFVEREASDTGLPGASADACLCVLLLHHVESPEGVIREMRRALRPGGVAMVVDMLPHTREEYRQTMGHRRLGFGEQEMRELLKGAGFAQVRIVALPIDPDAKGPALFVATGGG